jgi:hypothetical protein
MSAEQAEQIVNTEEPALNILKLDIPSEIPAWTHDRWEPMDTGIYTLFLLTMAMLGTQVDKNKIYLIQKEKNRKGELAVAMVGDHGMFEVCVISTRRKRR